MLEDELRVLPLAIARLLLQLLRPPALHDDAVGRRARRRRAAAAAALLLLPLPLLPAHRNGGGLEYGRVGAHVRRRGAHLGPRRLEARGRPLASPVDAQQPLGGVVDVREQLLVPRVGGELLRQRLVAVILLGQLPNVPGQPRLPDRALLEHLRHARRRSVSGAPRAQQRHRELCALRAWLR